MPVDPPRQTPVERAAPPVMPTAPRTAPAPRAVTPSGTVAPGTASSATAPGALTIGNVRAERLTPGARPEKRPDRPGMTPPAPAGTPEPVASSQPDEPALDGTKGTNGPSGTGGTVGSTDNAGFAPATAGTTAPAAPQSKQAVSLFAPLQAPKYRITEQDIPFVNAVDAALARKPDMGARALSLSVGLFFVICLFWAAWAKIDEVTHSEGQVVASQRTQDIQNLEGGILRGVLVREGQVVEKGTPLAQLDNEVAESNYRDALHRAMEHRAAIIRLEAELRGETPVLPDDLEKDVEGIAKGRVADNLRERAQGIIRDQQSIYRARTLQRSTELQLLESQSLQRQRDVEEQLVRKNQLDKSLQLAIEQRDIAYPLLQRRNYSRTEFLGLEQRVVQLQGDVESLASSIPKAQAAAAEAVQRIEFRKAELDAAITEEINKRRAELTSLRENLAAGGDRVTRTELRSPVRGTVKRIHINTVGGVVKPGESIMEVVPLDDTLLIEARVRPADVAFLHPGQKAVVKLSAYDYSIYGGLEGKLESISADTIEDKRGEFHYIVKIRTPKTTITYHNEELPIIPGMMATVDIMTGKKTVLDYILKPILKARQNALRER